MGDENTRLRAEVSRFEEKNDNRDRLLDSTHFNHDDLIKDYQVRLSLLLLSFRSDDVIEHRYTCCLLIHVLFVDTRVVC